MALDYDKCPAFACFLGYMGVMASIVFSNVGAAVGTSKAGVGILRAGVRTPDQVWRNLIPVVMAGVNGIYGLILSVILVGSITRPDFDSNENKYSLYTGFAHLAAGLCCGLSGLGSGICIGIAGDAAVAACGEFDVNLKKSDFFPLNTISGDGTESTDELDLMLQKMSKNRCGLDQSIGVDGGRGDKKVDGADKLFVAMVLIQVFAGNIALYGLIASIILSQQVFYCGDDLQD
mmetsp:Transcript_17531/g.25943  ORF Transcript_17531/g.25943 Transcript_17531/m.25943 type:complete len:233 (+) Transcript_17531:91-789(+)|eukprot:CAMPEP_0194212274 /NCGR_PEP_ID=MMETSP0156-20130528/11964_1 /TAXON_ID=33649 /ORGANISM="Thalassionema nitzschioides, Strain L26-B" /LENGTH=232 /DNA_ID=CAMNT_0038940055 /DNA_START=34 /DNA_END=732 /DNA_ORIENTATION=-